MRGQVSDYVYCAQGEFRRLRAASYFAHGGKVTKAPPGTAQGGHSVPTFAFPRTPITGDIPWGSQGISGAQNLSGGLRFLPAHWGLASPKLHSVRFKFCAWLYRTNGTGAGYAVGATLAVARKPSPWGGRCRANARRMRGQVATHFVGRLSAARFGNFLPPSVGAPCGRPWRSLNPVGREKVNCPARARETGLDHDSARRVHLRAGQCPAPTKKEGRLLYTP